jgi:hypothetical protein
MKSVCDVRACGSFSGVPLQCTVTKVTSGARSVIALLHTFWNKTAKNALFFVKTTLERPYPVLEHPFLLWYILSCFRRSYSVSEQKKNVEELLKKIWTCEVHVCNPKNAQISPFRFCIDIS